MIPTCKHVHHLSVLALAVVLTGFAAGNALAQVDIIDLHQNTSSGLPAAPHTVGSAVTVTGVITTGFGVFTTEYTDSYIQDATGGVMLYDTAIPYEFALGDSVTIVGTIEQYRGMTEVDVGTYTLHSSGAALPTPLLITCDDVENAFLPDYTEPNEGRLVQLNGVTWSGAWPSFSGPITLQDGTGICDLYIDGTTGIQDMTPPSGEFTVVGVIKQYDGYSTPYTSGYQLMPRWEADFSIGAGPQILAGPVETNIMHNSVTIHVETDTDTDMTVYYGLTASYELGSVTDGLNGTNHDVVLSGLDPATIYHYKVNLIDTAGQTNTSDLLFCSGSDIGCTGTVTAIFNKSAETDLAGGYGPANASENLSGWIIDRINATTSTIDVALYSFNLINVADALIAAKDRGVTIRFVYDNRTTYQAEVSRLQSEGIIVINDAYGPINDGAGIMHHKLWIFDAADPDPSKPWVYTGSWNLSSQGTYTDAQNTIMIQDQALAAVCTAEFNEMWGSDFWLPNPDNSRFGPNKLDNTPKRFSIGGRDAGIYFAPSDPWLAAIIDQVKTADYSINFAILSFTRYDLTNEMEELWMSIPGLAIRGVFDSAESGNTSSQYHPMHGDGTYAWDPPADVWLDGETGSCHHKYMIVDANQEMSDPVLITGSANWSNNANTSNDENVFIIHDATLANHYLQEFAARYHAAGGTAIFVSSVDDEIGSALRFSAGPNPSRGRLAINFSLPRAGKASCEIYSVDGRCVDRLLGGDIEAGDHSITWTPRPETITGSGVYYLKLTTEAGTLERRITLIK
jgi:phosphatidylserine/phosphatidylglycerophosphate/cardiolipin synthase-like enzyme